MSRNKKSIDRRHFLRLAAGTVASTGAALFTNLVSASSLHKKASALVDWSLRTVNSTLARTPDPSKFGVWGYQQGLYLLGQYLVYRRTGDRRLLNYIVGYVDAHIDAQGNLDKPIEALDDVMAANLFMPLYAETGDPRYRLAASKFRHRFDNYPRTTDGGFWHATRPSRQWQLWLDGNYMAVPFLVRYGRAFQDAAYANSEASRQVLVYHKHLKSTHRGLLYHAYDESGKAPWADPVTHRSSYFWCRAIGWYGMTLIDSLDAFPKNQSERAQLISILQELIGGLAYYQDPKAGLWYQVVDKPQLKENWMETSSSCMFTYIIDVAVKRGYVPNRYREVARKGYNGVLNRMSLGPDGLTNLSGICVGTDVGDLEWYLKRPRATNDLHGLGAFLLMNEEWNTSVSSMNWGSGIVRTAGD